MYRVMRKVKHVYASASLAIYHVCFAFYYINDRTYWLSMMPAPLMPPHRSILCSFPWYVSGVVWNECTVGNFVYESSCHNLAPTMRRRLRAKRHESMHHQQISAVYVRSLI